MLSGARRFGRRHARRTPHPGHRTWLTVVIMVDEQRSCARMCHWLVCVGPAWPRSVTQPSCPGFEGALTHVDE